MRPSRQIPLFRELVGSERGDPARSALAGGPFARTARPPARGTSERVPDFAARGGSLQTPLVNRCISQQGAGGVGAARPTRSPRASLGAVAFEVYPRSVRVVRPVSLPAGVTRGGARSSVDSFSEASKRRLRRVASEAGDQLVSQFCLTYQHSDPDGERVKRHLNAWLTWLRRRVSGIKYLWVLEFQKRGVPHLHVFLSIPVCTESTLHAEMAMKWHLITCEGDKAHLKFHQNAKNWIGWSMGSGSYVCKYLDKENQKHVPDYFGWVGRFWGSSRSLMPEPCVYDAHDIRAMVGQNADKARLNVSRETYGRDITATLIRTLGNYQQSKRRRYGRKGRHLSQVRSSRWVQDGAAVVWKLLDLQVRQGEKHEKVDSNCDMSQRGRKSSLDLVSRSGSTEQISST